MKLEGTENQGERGAHHLCWTKLAVNSGFTVGGGGCLNPDEKASMDAGKGSQSAARTAAARETTT